MNKLLVFVFAVMMAFAGVPAAADCATMGEICQNQSVFFGRAIVAPFAQQHAYTIDTLNLTPYSLNSNSSIILNVTVNNRTSVLGFGLGAASINVTACTLSLGANATSSMTAGNLINLTNSSPQAVSATQAQFTFLVANSTYGALAEKGRFNPYNVTVNCSITNGTSTFNMTNMTYLVVDITAPAITLNNPAQVNVNNTNGTRNFWFTTLDSGANKSNCSLFVAITNTTYSRGASFTLASNSSANLSDATNLSLVFHSISSDINTNESVINWLVQCADFAGNYANSSNRTYIVDN
ncbi:MAG: hypothetical protein Q7T16_02085, partial [Candidatus Burarchaeum sp.]